MNATCMTLSGGDGLNTFYAHIAGRIIVISDAFLILLVIIATNDKNELSLNALLYNKMFPKTIEVKDFYLRDTVSLIP